MIQRSRVDAQPAYVLHTYPFRETSLIVELFSRDFGRMALLARGARRPRSAIRGVLKVVDTGHGAIEALLAHEPGTHDPA